MNISAVILGFGILFVLTASQIRQVQGGPLACMKHAAGSRVAKRQRPEFVQMRRCCGDRPYHALTKQCCKNNETRQTCEDWTEWGSWSSCSVTCNSGQRHRYRTCVDGEGCDEQAVEMSKCFLPLCRGHCHTCYSSDSNEKCNALKTTCETEEGEGCQSIVRSENNFYFVEKRCKQLKACLIEGRQLAMQKSCDPLKTNSLCIYCCTGDHCNRNQTAEIPSWYTEEWKSWIFKLDRYSQHAEREKDHFAQQNIIRSREPESDGVGMFSNAITPLLLRKIPDLALSEAGRNSNENAADDWHLKPWTPDIDKVFISAIIDATEYDQVHYDRPTTVSQTMRNFVRNLSKNLPSDFKLPMRFKRRWLHHQKD